MQVISGKYRGKKINFSKNTKLRPTTSKVREAIFNLVDVRSKIVADIFGGTGSLSLEALSRGAKFIYINDKSIESLNLIRSNFLNLEDTISISNLDYRDFIFSLKDKQIDIFLIDPSYLLFEQYNDVISLINEQNLISEKTIIVIEIGQKIYHHLNIPNYLSILKEKNYGSNKVLIIKKGVKND